MKKILKFLPTFALTFFFLLPLLSYASFDKDLRYGLVNDDDVRSLQTFLTDQGIYTGPINGNYFSLTKKAVASFQDTEGILPATGYFGTKSRADANQLLEGSGLSVGSGLCTSF